MAVLKPLSMREAQRFWRDKIQMSPKEFKALSIEAKVRAFAIAGIAKGDELNSVFAALQRAIDSGTTFGDFKKEAGPIFERRGWTGKRAWRVDNIYRTNIQTAYNVGRYRQLVMDRDTLPYWMYSAVNDARTRPTHLAMSGRVWRSDNAVWNTWYPPNGYRCRCSVIALSARQVRGQGLKVQDKDITHRLIEPIDPQTGNKMPARQMIPDPGFAGNPGKDYWGDLSQAMAARLEAYPQQLAAAVLKDMVGAKEFGDFMQEPPGDFPMTRLSSEAAAAVGAGGRIGVFGKKDLVANLKGQRGVTVDDYRRLPEIGAHPDLVIKDNAGRSTLLARDGDRWLAAGIEPDRHGKLRIVSLKKIDEAAVSALKKTGTVTLRRKRP